MSDDEKTIEESTAACEFCGRDDGFHSPDCRTQIEAKELNRAKKGRGNKWIPDAEQHRQIKAMVAMGMLPGEIANVMSVSAPTIRRVCKEDPQLRSAVTQTDAKVAASLFNMATRPKNPVPACAIFWMKARRGWSDRPDAAGETPAKKQERKEAARRIGSSGKLAPGKGPAKLSVVK
jgi:hypothetical protein